MGNSYLPIEVKEAVVEACGRAFWLKARLFDVFRRAEIPDEVFRAHEGEFKFVIARRVLEELEKREDGYTLQCRLVTELCKLKDVPDNTVKDRDAALDSMRALKRVAVDHHVAVGEEKSRSGSRKKRKEETERKARERERKLGELYQRFTGLLPAHGKKERQARGYSLEDILRELFLLNEIEYRKSYRKEGEQIDGAFFFSGFDYIVEARWRAKPPELKDLDTFRGKVERNAQSTRGLFVSMAGFDEDVVGRFRQQCSSVILADGEDLTLILDGRVELRDGVQAKVDKAAQEGIIYYRLAELFRGR